MQKYSRNVFVIALLSGIGIGCTPSAPLSGPSTRSAPKTDASDNPLVKEARPDTEAVLKDLLAGEYDDDPTLSPVARKIKGFQSWAFETEEINPDLPQAVNFGGILNGPKGEANFAVLMVKQQNGK